MNIQLRHNPAARRSGLVLSLTAILALATGLNAASPYRLDPVFARPQFTGATYPYKVVDDGRGGLLWLVSNSRVDDVNGRRNGSIVRTFYDGSPDPTFNLGPVLSEAVGLAILPDKSILVGGALAGDFYNLTTPNCGVIRFTTNGVLDATFHSPVFDGLPWCITVQPDGRILVDNNGRARTQPTGGIRGLARLNANGSLDTTFQLATTDGSGNFPPIVVDTSSNILFGGYFTSVNDAARPGLARLLPNGTLDSTFDPTPALRNWSGPRVRGIVLQAGGKIVVAGRLYLPGDTFGHSSILARLNPDGTLDSGFHSVQAQSAGFDPYLGARYMTELPDGKLLLSGSTLARFNADGTPDSTFAAPTLSFPVNSLGGVYWHEILPDGAILVPSGCPVSVNGTAFPAGSFCLIKDGALKTNWNGPALSLELWGNNSVQPYLPALNFALQPGNLPVVWGAFDHAAGSLVRGVARLKADGTLDPSYGLALPPDIQSLASAGMDNTGGLYAEALSDSWNLPVTNSLVRLTADGAIDPGFEPDPARTSYDTTAIAPYTVLVQTNSCVIYRNSAQDVVDGAPFFLRLLPNGARDSAFAGLNMRLGTTNWSGPASLDSVGVGDLKIFSAGSNGILVGAIGTPNALDPALPLTYQIAKFNPDGTLLSGFSAPAITGPIPPSVTRRDVFDSASQTTYYPECWEPVSGSGPFSFALILSDDSVLVAGSFTRLGGTNVAGLARLLPNGSLDIAFGTTGAGASHSNHPLLPGRVDKIVLGPAGRVWITGDFDAFNGVAVAGIACLNADGSVDSSFASEVANFSYAGDNTDLALCDNGDLFVRGTFRASGETWPYALTRLTQHPALVIRTSGVSNGLFGLTIQNPAPGNDVVIEASTDLFTWSPVHTNSAALINFAETVSNQNHCFYRAASVSQ